MQLCVFNDLRVGIVEADDVLDISHAVPQPGDDPLRSVLEHWHANPAVISSARQDAARRPLASVQLRAPIRRPGKIVAAPVNYVDHMHEMSVGADIASLGVFLKAPSSVLDPGGEIVLPYVDRRFDQEGELALVIGRTARDVSEDDALDHVFGFCCLLDITMRGGEDRSTRKSFDTFTPMGPWLVTADEVPDDCALRLRCWVNDDLRQSASTHDLIWGVPRLLAYASSVMTLFPGDVVTTGTPAGVGPLLAGDRVAVEIDTVGRLEVSVSDAGRRRLPHRRRGADGPTPPLPHPRT